MDALGNPLKFYVTPGQDHDITQAENLTGEFEFTRLIADKGYDAANFIESVGQHAEVVIPSRVNRRQTRDYDRHIYKERHLVECFIGKIKHFRRVFSRFDKLSKNYLSFIYFASSLIC